MKIPCNICKNAEQFKKEHFIEHMCESCGNDAKICYEAKDGLPQRWYCEDCVKH